MSLSQIHNFVADYYSKRLDEFGANAQGVDWNGPESQELRFKQLLTVCDSKDSFSLLDYGCGYGALLPFVREKSPTCQFVGFDLTPEMIREARRVYGNSSDATFLDRRDRLTACDFVVASGIFNVRGEISDGQWSDYILSTLKEIDSLSMRGFAFNMLTSYSDSDKMKRSLFYADPCHFFDICKRNFSGNVALLHDYGLYEFTVIVRKQT